jgi:putative SOS response-associated peptidase YedK
MCGRYAFPVQPDELPELLSRQEITVERVEQAEKRTEHEYNIAPSEFVPVYMKNEDNNSDDNDNNNDSNKTNKNTNTNAKNGIIQYMRWGLVPIWVHDQEQMKKSGYATFNARYENLKSNRLWKSSLKHRCVVPISGYYEWTKDKNKIPYYVKRKDDKVMFLPGLYNQNKIENEQSGSFTVITRRAPEYLKWLHIRMPIILNPEDPAFDMWLNGDFDFENILKVYSNKEDLDWYRVDGAVGNSRTDDKKYVVPWKEPFSTNKRKKKNDEEEEEDDDKTVKEEIKEEDHDEDNKPRKKQKVKSEE